MAAWFGMSTTTSRGVHYNSRLNIEIFCKALYLYFCYMFKYHLKSSVANGFLLFNRSLFVRLCRFHNQDLCAMF